MKLSALIGLAAGVLLAACAAVGPDGPAARHFEIPTTASVVVRQAIVIPGGSAHAILQGAPVTRGELRRYEPYCEIELNDVHESEQAVRPGRFAITRVVRESLWAADDVPGRLTALAAAVKVDCCGSTDAPYVLKGVRLRLHASEQPNVRELRCMAGWALAPVSLYPTVVEMREALGSFVAIEMR